MAVSARAFSLSLFTGLSFNPHQPPLPPPSFFAHNLLIRPLLPVFSVSRRRSYAGAVSCVVSGVDGGGVSDDFISTRKAGFGSEFSVIANMLKKIEPLDSSVISKGVSDSAKDSMKQTISTMLGLLPSDQFSVTVRVSKRPLDRLLTQLFVQVKKEPAKTSDGGASASPMKSAPKPNSEPKRKRKRKRKRKDINAVIQRSKQESKAGPLSISSHPEVLSFATMLYVRGQNDEHSYTQLGQRVENHQRTLTNCERLLAFCIKEAILRSSYGS